MKIITNKIQPLDPYNALARLLQTSRESQNQLGTTRLTNRRNPISCERRSQFRRRRTANYKKSDRPEIDRTEEPIFPISDWRQILNDFLYKNGPIRAVSGPGKPPADLGRFRTPRNGALDTTRDRTKISRLGKRQRRR